MAEDFTRHANTYETAELLPQKYSSRNRKYTIRPLLTSILIYLLEQLVLLARATILFVLPPLDVLEVLRHQLDRKSKQQITAF